VKPGMFRSWAVAAGVLIAAVIFFALVVLGVVKFIEVTEITW